jgi:hypothetical protein
MTRVIKIFNAASEIFLSKEQVIFTRADVRDQLDLSGHDWEMGYTAIFQGMIENCPEKSNKILSKYRGIFRRMGRGKYTFTDYGLSLLGNNINQENFKK